jgi:hypothetical protein
MAALFVLRLQGQQGLSFSITSNPTIHNNTYFTRTCVLFSHPCCIDW